MPRGKSRDSLELIEACDEILVEIHPATVRAVCYRLFASGRIESMAKKHTNRVSAQLVYAREHRIIPWDWIVDETRKPERAATWADPQTFAKDATRAYRRDRWLGQGGRVEVWSEKGTPRGTLAPVLDEYGVTFRVMHGYASATAVYQAAIESEDDPRPLRVLYAGDWDPSGLHMSERDLPARLKAYGARNIHLCRLALAAEDIADPELPSFSADTKRGDRRWRWYTERYGSRCWELDALSPVVLRQRVKDAIEAPIDWPAWERYGRAEEAERESIARVLGRWPRRIPRQATE